MEAFTTSMAWQPFLTVSLPVSFLLMSSILPVVKVLLIAATGFAFAHPSLGVFDASARKSLSKLVFSIFLPAIIFVNLGEAISLDNLLLWWFIPVNVLIASLIGCLIGTLVSKLTACPPQFSRITCVMTGIGNMGNLPLVLIVAVCSDSRNPFGESATCTKTGTAYISLGMWMAAIVMWGFVYNMVAPPDTWLPGWGGLPTTESMESIEGAKRRFSPPLEEEQNGIVGVNGKRVKKEEEEGLRSALLLTSMSRKENKLLSQFVAMAVGMTPPVRAVLFDPSGPLRFATDSIAILGQAMIPCILLVLGGNLVGGPGSSELPLRTTAVLVATRLLLVPTIGIAVVMTADWLGFLPPQDPLFRFVLFMQHAMPSSIQIGTACSLQGFGEKEVSAVLFYQHVVAVFTMTFFLFIFFYLLFGA